MRRYFFKLDERQIQVIEQMLVEGHRCPQIAERLGCNDNTVRAYKKKWEHKKNEQCMRDSTLPGGGAGLRA